MAEHRPHETLIDEALDRELRGLLDVEPSPEFVARVRRRVAAEPMGHGAWFAWRWMLAGTATIALAAAIVMLANRQQVASVTSPGQSAPVSSSQPPRITEAAPQDPRAIPQTANSAAAQARNQSRPAAERSAPEVLVSPTEAAGLRYLLTALREGRIDPNVVPLDQAGADSEAPITIPPIIVEPLSVAADLEQGVGP